MASAKRLSRPLQVLVGVVVGLDPLIQPGRVRIFRTGVSKLGGRCLVLPLPPVSATDDEVVASLPTEVTHLLLSTAENETTNPIRIQRRKRLLELLPRPSWVLKDEWLQQCLKQQSYTPEAPYRLDTDYTADQRDEVSEESQEVEEEEDQKKERKKRKIDPEVPSEDEMHPLKRSLCQLYPLQHPNMETVKALAELATFYDVTARSGAELKQRYLATTKVIAALIGCGRPIRSAVDARKVPAIGERSGKRIEAIVKTGTTDKLERFRGNPRAKALLEMTRIIGVGRSIAQRWFDTLDLHSLQDVKDAAENGSLKLTRLQQFALDHYDELNEGIERDDATKLVEEVKAYMRSIASASYRDGLVKVECVGGYRREKPHSHDVDILFTSRVGDEAELLAQTVAAMQQDLVLHTIQVSGKTTGNAAKLLLESQQSQTHDNVDIEEEVGAEEASVDSNAESAANTGFPTKGRQFLGFFRKPSIARGRWCRLDLVTCRLSEWPFALLAWTGSKRFERMLRLYAKRCLGYRLTSHALTTLQSPLHAFPAGLNVPLQTGHEDDHTTLPTDEKGVFDLLRLPYLPPKYRNA